MNASTASGITIAEQDFVLLIFRLSIGITIAAHGWNKIFGGGRIKGTGRWFQSIGMKPGIFMLGWQPYQKFFVACCSAWGFLLHLRLRE